MASAQAPTPTNAAKWSLPDDHNWCLGARQLLWLFTPIPVRPAAVTAPYETETAQSGDGFRTEYRIAKYRTQNIKTKNQSRKMPKSHNIEVAEYRVAKYRMRKISKMQNIVSHDIEWQNIDHTEYRRTK